MKIFLIAGGGLQEETTALAGTTKEGILRAYAESLNKVKHVSTPPLWDGKASERIWKILLR